MTGIYFPARTNVHYWDLESLDPDLESRMKLSALIFNELTFDDGAYTALVGTKGNVEIVEYAPSLDSNYDLPKEGGEFTVAYGDWEMTSPALRRYHLCFRRMLEEIGVIEFPWINFTRQECGEESKKRIKKLVETDMEALHSQDRETYLLHKWLLYGLNHDLIIGLSNEWTLNMDPLREDLLRHKLKNPIGDTVSQNLPIDFEILFPKLPDLTHVSWDQILETREHPVAVEFRERLASATCQAQQAYLSGADVELVRSLVKDWIEDQLLNEFQEQLKTKKQTVFEIGKSLLLFVVGFIPGFGAAAGAIDTGISAIEAIREYREDRQSFAATLIRRYNHR